MLENKQIAIIGYGTMGQTIVAGLIRSGKVRPEHVRVTTRSRPGADKIAQEQGVRASTDNVDAVRQADIVVLCVKPKDIQRVVHSLRTKNALEHNPMLISIAAGISTSFVETVVGDLCPVIRAMPNTPCLIGKGMTVVARGTLATDEHAQIAVEIFSTMGRCIELDEKHMDTVTGLSASGPAFIYLIIEALTDGGVARGLPRKVASELVAQMTMGAAEMVLTTGKHPAALKDDVTTPAGCTIAGILALEDGRIRSVLARGVETAARVATELGT